MAKRTNERVVSDGETGVTEGQPEMPQWAVPGEETQQVAVYQPPAASQWRRDLLGPELLQYVASQVKSYDGDEEAMGLDIFNQVANAATVEEILSGKVETTKGRDILGVPLVCEAIRFVVSTEPAGCPYFVVFEVRRSDTNERMTVTKGGWRLVAQAGMLHYLSEELPEGSPFLCPEGVPGAKRRETYPHYFKLMETQTNSGNRMSYLTGLMS